jgi:hypothetical protein
VVILGITGSILPDLAIAAAVVVWLPGRALR